MIKDYTTLLFRIEEVIHNGGQGSNYGNKIITLEVVVQIYI